MMLTTIARWIAGIIGIAIFLAAIPMSYAAEIFTVSVAGSEGINGWAKSNDQFTVTADVTLGPSIEVRPNNVVVGQQAFDSCSVISPTQAIYRCTYSESTVPLQNPYNTLYIVLLNNSGITEDTAQVILKIDNLPPQVLYFFARNKNGVQSSRVNNNLSFAYSINDQGCSGCGNVCVGIGNVVISTALANSTRVLHTRSVSEPEVCSLSVDQRETSSLPDGNYSFCLNASDKFSQTAQRCTNIVIDNTRPDVLARSAEFFQGTRKITKYLGVPVNGVFKVNISDQNDLNFDSVNADLRGIGGTTGAGSCLIASNNLKTCSWQTMLRLEGSKNVTVSGADTAGNAFQKTFEFNLAFDTTSPVISGFRLTKEGERESGLKFINGPTTAVLTVNISDDGIINLSSITADLSVFGLSSNTMPDLCRKPIDQASLVQCDWTVQISFNRSESGSLYVNASDMLRNTKKQRFDFEILLDTTSPVVQSIKTGVEYKNKSYASPNVNTTITAKIKESGSGFSARKVFMNLSQLNGLSNVAAESCTELSGTWTCVWNVNLTSRNEQATVTITAQDDAGNNAVGNLSAVILIDSQPPVMTNFSFRCIGNETELAYYCKEGDLAEISIRISDDLPANARANLSLLASGLSNVAGDCTVNETSPVLTDCKYTVEGIEPSVIFNRSVAFMMTDLAGNRNTSKKVIPVLSISNLSESDFWSVSQITRSPKMIDAQTTGLIQHRVFFHLFLEPKQDNIEILSLQSKGCTGNTQFLDGGSEGQVYPVEFFNNLGRDPRDPFIKFTLETANIGKSLNFVCELSIISRVGKEVVPEEIENVSLTIPLFDLSIGELGQQVNKEIEDVTKRVENTKWIGDIQNIINIAAKICNLINVWGTLVNAYATFSAAFEAWNYVPVGGSSKLAEFQKIKTEKFKNLFYNDIINTAGEYCGYISCDRGLIWGQWYENMIDKSRDTFEWSKNMHFNCKQVIEKDSKLVVRSQFQQFPGLSDSTLQKCGATIWPVSPKDSIILSAATGCIPGILYNLEKQRQIDCTYLLCLKKEVPNGIPLEACKAQHGYAECKYFYGQVFQILPFAHFFQSLAEQVKTIVKNPVGLIFGVIDIFCDTTLTNLPHSVCIIGKTLPTLGKVIELFTSFEETFNWNVGNDVCKEALKDE